MARDKELRERRAALERGGEEAMAEGLPLEQAEYLCGILSRHVNAFQRALRGDHPASMERRKFRLTPGAQAIKAHPHRYGSTKIKRLAGCVAALTAISLVVVDLQAVWASAAICVPARDSFGLVSYYKCVNAPIERLPRVIPFRETQMMGDLLGGRCFGKIGVLHWYWLMPPAPEVQEEFAIMTPEELYVPTKVP